MAAAASGAEARGFQGAWVRSVGIALLALPLLGAAPRVVERNTKQLRSLPLREAVMAKDVALVASYLPARRATRLKPSEVLKTD